MCCCVLGSGMYAIWNKVDDISLPFFYGRWSMSKRIRIGKQNVCEWMPLLLREFGGGSYCRSDNVLYWELGGTVAHVDDPKVRMKRRTVGKRERVNESIGPAHFGQSFMMMIALHPEQVVDNSFIDTISHTAGLFFEWKSLMLLLLLLDMF